MHILWRCAGWRGFGVLLCLIIVGGGIWYAPAPVHAATTRLVTSSGDGGNDSLRYTISIANSGDTIVFDPAVFPPGATTPVVIHLFVGLGSLTINKDLTIIGPGARAIAIDGDCLGTYYCGMPMMNGFSALTITNGATVTISGMTMQDGDTGITNSGTLTLMDSTISANFSYGDGGGITNNGTLTVLNSTISGNSARDSHLGGGITNHGTLTLKNSTVSGNTAGDGGGISNDSTATATLLNDTVSGNTATGGIGGGITTSNGGTTVASNTLIVNNTPAALSGPLASPSTHDLMGPFTFTSPLTDNGGPTATLAIAPTSPAAGAGDATVCGSERMTGIDGASTTVDQRGAARIVNGACAIGAFEPGLVRTFTALSMTPATATAGTNITLTAHVSDILGDVPPNGATITFLDGMTPLGTGTLTSGAATLHTTAPTTTANLTARYDGNAFHASSSSSGLGPLPLPPLVILPAQVNNLSVGYPYNQPLTGDGGAGGPYTFALAQAGTLPPGEQLVGSAIIGPPTTPGVYTFTIIVTDQAGNTASQQYTQGIFELPLATPTTLPSVVIGNPYHQQFMATGGYGPPYTFTPAPVSPNLPPGLTLSSDGLLSGTPTQGGYIHLSRFRADEGIFRQPSLRDASHSHGDRAADRANDGQPPRHDDDGRRPGATGHAHHRDEWPGHQHARCRAAANAALKSQ